MNERSWDSDFFMSNIVSVAKGHKIKGAWEGWESQCQLLKEQLPNAVIFDKLISSMEVHGLCTYTYK